MMMNKEAFSEGFNYYKSGGVYIGMLPKLHTDHSDWIQGFCCAQADYDYDYEYQSIEEALTKIGIDDMELLEELLYAAEHTLEHAEEWIRWPNVPIRKFKNETV